ncbi:MAG TPA: response regulator [Verrucomicrobiae bacterium]|nr:response regulator [Verrucomicrobiae bacterium]
MPPPIPPLLLVDDDEADIFLLQRALQKANLTLPEHIVTDGEEAIDYLSGRGPFADRNAFPIPHAIFLDLKMPFVSGFEVLEWIRTQPQLASIPVFVLTGSSIERDRQRAFELGARHYLTKPATPALLVELLCPRDLQAAPAANQ